MSKKKSVWKVWGRSESGDYYPEKKYHKKPTDKDLKNYVLKETPEQINIGGPGIFGSYVYLTIVEEL